MGEIKYVTIRERQAELQLHITNDRRKCQTQTKVDGLSLKAKTSATEWILWKNALQRYLKEMGLGGHAAVTQLWKCRAVEHGTALRRVREL